MTEMQIIFFSLLWELILGTGDIIPTHWWSLEEVNALLGMDMPYSCSEGCIFAVTTCTDGSMEKSRAVIGTRLKSVQRYENFAHAVINGRYSAAYVRPEW